MILENWQIKVLQYQLDDYEAWIDNVVNGKRWFNGVESNTPLFDNPDAIIQNKINKCLGRMINNHSHLELEGLTDEEKVNLITSQQSYKRINPSSDLVV